ncbi:TAXI family TRAP transporter solute-binding subunit [Rhodomicrobium sp. R_RK_3]|nr:TAXI family TRAP transporter solute-binding subunit [Rhodomicrobium sp. R_RK_3]
MCGAAYGQSPAAEAEAAPAPARFGTLAVEAPYRVAQAAQAATPPASSDPITDRFVDELNANTITILSGNPNGTYLFFAYDMSAVLDDGNRLRVLPVIGKGAAQNTKDILYLRNTDMGITQSDILRHYSNTGEVGRNIANRLRYITRLYNEEMHLLVAPNINKVEDLRGKKVNFSDAGSGTQISNRIIFDALKVKVEEVNMGQEDAFEALKRGDISATVLFGGKPAGAFARIEANPSKYKLLPVPYVPDLQEVYLPATFSHDDYPNLIAEGQTVDTIAVGAVLAVFNWAPGSERYRRVAKFTKALFENFDKFLQKPRHPKWKEVNLAAELPGWQRFGAAQELLNKPGSAPVNAAQLKRDFDRFLTNVSPKEAAQGMSEDRREELFRSFLEWQGTQQR